MLALPDPQSLSRRRGGLKPIAGVSSFGFSGTNCHVVVAAPPPSTMEEDHLSSTDREASMHLLVLSSNLRSSLKGLASATLDYLHSKREGGASMATICWAMSNGRAALQHRVAIVAHTKVRPSLTRFDPVCAFPT